MLSIIAIMITVSYLTFFSLWLLLMVLHLFPHEMLLCPVDDEIHLPAATVYDLEAVFMTEWRTEWWPASWLLLTLFHEVKTMFNHQPDDCDDDENHYDEEWMLMWWWWRWWCEKMKEPKDSPTIAPGMERPNDPQRSTSTATAQFSPRLPGTESLLQTNSQCFDKTIPDRKGIPNGTLEDLHHDPGWPDSTSGLTACFTISPEHV